MPCPGQELRDYLSVQGCPSPSDPAERIDELEHIRHPVLEQVPHPAGLIGEQLDGIPLLDVLREHEHPYLRPAVTDHHCGTQALVEVCRRHPDVDDAHVGDLLRDRPQQCFTVADRSGHPQPLLLKQANQALAQQDRVFGDDNTQRLSHHRAPRSSARSGPRED